MTARDQTRRVSIFTSSSMSCVSATPLRKIMPPATRSTVNSRVVRMSVRCFGKVAFQIDNRKSSSVYPFLEITALPTK